MKIAESRLHREVGRSDDVNLPEVVMPADFATEKVDAAERG